VNTVDNVITTYGYDNKSRLTGQQTAGAVVTLTMDAVDNVLVKWYQGQAPITMTVDAASRLQTANQAGIITTFTFDGAGNQTVSHTLGSIATSTFDGENRNTKIVWANGEISTYTWQGYNSMRRTNQEPGQPVYTTIWDGTNYLGEY
jgi:YD repeat-containing protein